MLRPSLRIQVHSADSLVGRGRAKTTWTKIKLKIGLLSYQGAVRRILYIPPVLIRYGTAQVATDTTTRESTIFHDVRQTLFLLATCFLAKIDSNVFLKKCVCRNVPSSWAYRRCVFECVRVRLLHSNMYTSRRSFASTPFPVRSMPLGLALPSHRH